ncbi:hypothetical protein BV20DRAFT_910484, partial [Pilatotrama ljubarskyi]
VADALSRTGEGAQRTTGDGSEWTVCEDWEANLGLVNDLFQVTAELPETEHEDDALLNRFAEEPLFTEVIKAIMNATDTLDERTARRAKHRAAQYMIAEGKLWRLRTTTTTRARARVECITRAEAIEKARQCHEERGHWGRDSIKIALLDQYWSPKLDASILEAI